MKRKNLEFSHAFSLMELLAVIAILGLILAILIPNLSQGTRAANEQAIKITAKQIDEALQTASANGINLGDNPAEVIRTLNNGVKTKGGLLIQLSLSTKPEDIASLMRFMKIKDGRAIYYPDGVPRERGSKK